MTARNFFLKIGLAVGLMWAALPVSAQYVNVQVNFNTIKHWETSACWESGDEEYSAWVYANLDGGGWTGSFFQITSGNSCTQPINYTPISQNTLATTLGTRLYAWEDDSGNRNSYDSGDDCRNDDSWSFTIRSLARATWNAYNDYGTSNHKCNFSIYWNWLAPPAPSIGSASSVANTSFTANWSGPANYRVVNYYLTVATDSGFANIVSGYNGLDMGTATSRSVTGLAAGLTYYFRVTAANEAGTSGVSGTGSAALPKYDQTITFTQPANKTYGDAAFALSASASSGLGVTFSLVSGPATVTGGGTVTLTGVGTVTVRASQAGNGSYNAAPNVDRSFTVAQKTLTVSGAAVTSKTYDGSAAATLTGTLSGIAGGDTVTLNGTGTFNNKNAGTGKAVTATCTLGGAQAGNYTLTQPTGLTGTISARALTVTAVTATKTYDSATTSSGTPTLTSGVIQTGDAAPTWTQTFDSKSVSAVNGRTLTPAGVVSDGNGGNNYSYTYATALGTITAKALTITAAAKSKVYGAADPALTYTADGLIEGDTVAGALTRVAGEAVGTYAIGQGTLDAGANYTLAYTGADLTVNKAPLVCKPADAFSVQGLALPAFTIGYQGFVNGESAGVLDTPPTAACAATVASPRGSYAITCEGGTDNNYDFVRQTGTLRIRERATLIRVF